MKFVLISCTQADFDVDVESIPLPASILNRRSASFRHNHNESRMSSKLKSRASIPNALNNHHQTASSIKLPANRDGDGNRFKLADILNNQKNKITSLDMHQYPALNHLNATLKRICRSNATPSMDRLKERSLERPKRMPFESFSIDAETYHELMAKNQPLPMDVSELRDACVRPSASNLTTSTLADIQSVHASTCNLVTALRASSQSILGDGGGGGGGGGVGNSRFGRNCSSNSAMNLRYDSLRSHKGRSKRSNSEQLNSSYYHFQNIDGELDNNSITFDSVLLTNHSNDNYKLPWKHRQCPSISSSGSSNSSNMSSKC